MPDQHADWLRLVEISGPFLAPSVLRDAFPQGLDQAPRERIAELRLAWREQAANPELHGPWVRWVLRELLELGPVLLDGADLPSTSRYRDAGSGATIAPHLAVVDQREDRPRLLVRVETRGTALGRAREVDGWRASPVDRLAALLRATGVPVGVATDGAEWVLVWARPGETTGTCTWNVDYWLEERPTLDAFWSLLSARRFFAVAEEHELERLLDRSADAQTDVTDQLGRQVRRAVELLVQDLARRDSDHRGRLLDEVAPDELYRAAVTVAMRLVFLFVAEERGLLPLDQERYARDYAASTLREQLQERADRDGEQPLEGSSAAWHRLLALFRAVHGGLDHHDLHLPAYGGGLMDPDRYPFLEGRAVDTGWRTASAAPVRISDRTVLHVLDAIQVLRPTGRGARNAVPVRLSFRALDVEQIGHVYEGLLDHTAVRSTDAALGLAGKKSKDGDVEPELALDELEAAAAASHAVLRKYLVDHTKLTAAKVEQALDAEADEQRIARLRTSCRNDHALFQRALPYVGLIRDDLRGYPLVFLPGEAYVTDGLDRRSSGTHYTPRSMAEEVVLHALDPIVHDPGPQDNADPATWRLKPAAELLDLKVCDIAMGSGAFLVASCRYLAGQLQRAWDRLDDGEWTAFGRTRRDAPDEPALPVDAVEREQLALRLVAERCLYGVDVNPMAVEMAKVSLWLTTLAKDRPFSFLDHALRVGDSLLGVTSTKQLRALSLDPSASRGKASRSIWAELSRPEEVLSEARAVREELERLPVNDVVDAEHKRMLLERAETSTEDLRLVGDLLVGASLRHGAGASDALVDVSDAVRLLLAEATGDERRAGARQQIETRAESWLEVERDAGVPSRRPFHWPLAFPEVWAGGGFDAFVGNPPFQGGRKIGRAQGDGYRAYLVRELAGGRRGSADLVAYFFLRAAELTRRNGGIALVATNSVAQGDTREVGLDRLVHGPWSLYRGVSSEPWPSGANLEIAKVWARQGGWNGAIELDGEPAPGIGPDLWAAGRVSGTPRRLAANAGKAFQGSIVLGMGFVLSRDEAQRLLERDPRNADVVKPYLNGEDLNQRPDGSASRYVIDMGERTEAEAREYAHCFAIIEERVKPERLKQDAKKYPRMVHEWWKFWNARPALNRAISPLRRVIVIAQVSKTAQPVMLQTGPVFSGKTIVFASDRWDEFGLLSSGVHWWWTARRSTTLKMDFSYTPTDVRETLPLPVLTDTIRSVGEALSEYRTAMQFRRQEGLTTTYNRYHDPDERADDVRRLREIHVELDRAVRDAYGWNDLELGHDFYETRFGVRFTFEPIVRQEILDRLLERNHAQYNDEVRRGRHGTRRGNVPVEPVEAGDRLTLDL